MDKPTPTASTATAGCTSTLTGTFILMKLMGLITWSWWWVLSPMLLFIAVVILVLSFGGMVVLLGTFFGPREAKSSPPPQSIQEVPSRWCDACRARIQADELKCRYCGTVLASEEWRDFARRYQESSADERRAILESLGSTQRDYFSRLSLVLGASAEGANVQPASGAGPQVKAVQAPVGTGPRLGLIIAVTIGAALVASVGVLVLLLGIASIPASEPSGLSLEGVGQGADSEGQSINSGTPVFTVVNTLPFAGGYRKDILISSRDRTDVRLRALANQLSFETRSIENAVIDIYDDRSAVGEERIDMTREGGEERFVFKQRHFVGQFIWDAPRGGFISATDTAGNWVYVKFPGRLSDD